MVEETLKDKVKTGSAGEQAVMPKVLALPSVLLLTSTAVAAVPQVKPVVFATTASFLVVESM